MNINNQIVFLNKINLKVLQIYSNLNDLKYIIYTATLERWGRGLELWCLTQLKTTFQLYHGGQFC